VGAFEADPQAVYSVIGRFFHALAIAGVRHVVVSPGSRSTPLAITARQVPGLRTWIELDERAAAFFALGLARESGAPAVLVCTSGTAAANYLPAVIEAHYARVPMIVATADRPPERRDWGVGQTIEQVGLYGGYTRWAVDLPVPTAGADAERHAVQTAARAVALSTGRPAGTVHLNWPLREPLPPPEGRLTEILAAACRDSNPPSTHPGLAVASSEAVKTLAEWARTTERGVVCAGPMPPDPRLAEALRAFARAAGWPVLCDPASNLRAGADPADAPLLDAGDVLTRSSAFTAAHRPEIVLRIGDLSVSKAQRLWIEASAPREVVWLDEGGQWGEPSHLATRIWRGGAASLFEGAAERLSTSAGLRQRAWCRDFEAANARARTALSAAMTHPSLFSGLSAADTLARHLPDGATLFVANSMSIRWLDLALAARRAPLRVFASRGAAGIDGQTSTALGVAAASGRRTWLLTGDLALLHDLSGLLISVRESIDLTIVVVDDGGGGIFSMLPVASQGSAVAFDELFQTPHGVDLGEVARLFGLEGERATDQRSLNVALERARERSGVSIIHVPVDSRENVARFRSVVAEAIEAIDRSGSAPEGRA
jgi:2-succinyl-5-enolpyruvyl-6-hydroxy-3-cyclohexene-1-carboxylate synthase